MATFLLEIGFEELPSRFLSDVEQDLSRRMQAELVEQDLVYGGISVDATPRRAVVKVDGLPGQQPIREIEVVGPPARIAYAQDGTPTRAATGFAASQNVGIDDLYHVDTEKGKYLAARIRSGGRATAEVLADFCPGYILGIPFPKRMHWGSGDTLFARPLRWIVALLDSEVVPFEVAGLHSGRMSYGHRIHGRGPFSVPSAREHAAIVEHDEHVVLRAQDRRDIITRGGNRLAAEVGGTVLWKDSLVDEVQGLTEHPVPLLGKIDRRYLDLPREVLLTSMEKHQKSFGIAGPDGRLEPWFLTVLNLTPPDVELVRHGWERVLRARLEDARFFWESDLAAGLDEWLQALDGVTFLAPLGSMGDKTRRLSDLCRWLAEHVRTMDGSVADPDSAGRAGRLSKADLVSDMVGEFDTLQGIMGGIYARRKGEDGDVCTALSEQYLPSGPDSPVPSTLLGSLLSIADKADTLAGCFGLGMMPTGAADPYALRRCALGIARIMLERGLRLDVEALFARAFKLYGERRWKYTQEKTLALLREFFVARVKYMLLGQGGDTLLVEAVTAVHTTDVWGIARRLEALTVMSRQADFPDAVRTFKRVANIIRKQGKKTALSGEWREDLLREEPERRLAAVVTDFVARFRSLLAVDDYLALFAMLGSVRPAVDAFFDGVMVMCDDVDLRTNRLNLLSALLCPLSQLADFSALQR